MQKSISTIILKLKNSLFLIDAFLILFPLIYLIDNVFILGENGFIRNETLGFTALFIILVYVVHYMLKIRYLFSSNLSYVIKSLSLIVVVLLTISFNNKLKNEPLTLEELKELNYNITKVININDNLKNLEDESSKKLIIKLEDVKNYYKNENKKTFTKYDLYKLDVVMLELNYNFKDVNEELLKNKEISEIKEKLK